MGDEVREGSVDSADDSPGDMDRHPAGVSEPVMALPKREVGSARRSRRLSYTRLGPSGLLFVDLPNRSLLVTNSDRTARASESQVAPPSTPSRYIRMDRRHDAERRTRYNVQATTRLK